MIEPRLQYIYAVIDNNNCCVGVITGTNPVPLDSYILIPTFSNEYKGKYYDRVSGKWFYEPEHITEFIPA